MLGTVITWECKWSADSCDRRIRHCLSDFRPFRVQRSVCGEAFGLATHCGPMSTFGLFRLRP
jgi:hypothetical protein